MTPSDSAEGSLAGIRKLRGVSWEWRPAAPIDREGREAGVIAQDVEAVFPDLVDRAPEGHLRVDYGGLTIKLREALLELDDRMREAESEAAVPTEAVNPVETALASLRSGDLRSIDHTALVGMLVEAVKDLDGRIAEMEKRVASERD